MKRKRGLLIVLILVAAVLCIMSGCGIIGKKLMENAVEKSVENAIEGALDGNIDITDDGTSYEWEGGSYQTGEDLPWPGDAMGDLPVPDARITYVMRGETSCSVEVSDFAKDDAIAYQEALIALGYTEGMQGIDETGISFWCTKADGSSASLSYDFSSQSGSITYALPEEGYTPPEEDYTPPEEGGAETGSDWQFTVGGEWTGIEDTGEEGAAEEEIDMIDVAEWPADFMGDIPEPEGKITTVMRFDQSDIYIEVKHVSRETAEAYLEILPALGYTNDANIGENEESVGYFGRNDDGDWVTIMWSEMTLQIELNKAE